MNKKLKFILVIVVVIASVDFILVSMQNKKIENIIIENINMKSNNQIKLSAGEVLFTGIITEIDSGCILDRECSFIVTGKTVLWNKGMTVGSPGQPENDVRGKLINDPGDMDKYLGKKVEVYGVQISPPNPDYITIYGKEIYYIKFLNK